MLKFTLLFPAAAVSAILSAACSSQHVLHPEKQLFPVLPTRQLEGKLLYSYEPPASVAFSPDGTRLAICTNDRKPDSKWGLFSLHVLDIATKTLSQISSPQRLSPGQAQSICSYVSWTEPHDVIIGLPMSQVPIRVNISTGTPTLATDQAPDSCCIAAYHFHLAQRIHVYFPDFDPQQYDPGVLFNHALLPEGFVFTHNSNVEFLDFRTKTRRVLMPLGKLAVHSALVTPDSIFVLLGPNTPNLGAGLLFRIRQFHEPVAIVESGYFQSAYESNLLQLSELHQFGSQVVFQISRPELTPLIFVADGNGIAELAYRQNFHETYAVTFSPDGRYFIAFHKAGFELFSLSHNP